MTDFRNSKLEDRFRNDAAFHSLVNAITDMISAHGFTPSELREALFLAHYRYEMENPSIVNYQMKLRMKEFYELDKELKGK